MLTRKGLVEFQSQNKLLFMSYNQNEMRIMGRIYGNMDSRELRDVYDDYAYHFYKMISTPPKHTLHINVLMHGLGYFSDYISSSERSSFKISSKDTQKGWYRLAFLFIFFVHAL
jgi:uncharacterized protein YbgA (DUF1722 family)